MDLKSFTPTNGVVLPQRPLPRTKCIPRLIQTGSTRKRSTCFSPATIVLCLAVGARGRPQRAQRSAVCLMSIRDAREAIRDCLRENRTMPVLQALPEDSLQQILDTMTRMELKAGEHIFRKGEPVDAVYVVESGELSVVKPLRQGEEEEAFEATTLGPGSYIGELGLFYDRTCMENVSVRGDKATLWQLKRTDFFEIIDRLEEEIGGECQMPEEILDREPASVFVVSDGSGYSAGGAVNLALKQFENQANKNCETVNVTSFPYIRYKGEISQVAKRARQENALIVYTLMRKEPRQAMLEELERPLKEGENPLRAVDLWEPLLLSMEDLLGIPRNSEA
ncbi:cGMP-dependent protein kinase egl-4 (Egg-laying defective protein 4), partial [Durusdinium trenchii]